MYLNFLILLCDIFSLHKKCPNTKFFWSVFFLYSDWIRRFTEQISVFSPNTGKYGQEKTPYLDTFHAVFDVTNFNCHPFHPFPFINTPQSNEEFYLFHLPLILWPPICLGCPRLTNPIFSSKCKLKHILLDITCFFSRFFSSVYWKRLR